MSPIRYKKWLLPLGFGLTPFILWEELLDPALTIRFIYLTVLGLASTALLWVFRRQQMSSGLSGIISFRNPTFLCILTWLAFALISLSVANSKSEGWLEISRIVFFLFSYLWISLLLSIEIENVVYLAIGFCVMAFFLSVFGIKDFSIVKIASGDSYYRMIGQMGNRNLLAIMLSLCLPFHFIVYENYRSKQVRTFIVINFLLALTVAVLTSSRVGWLGLAVMLLLCLIVSSVGYLKGFRHGKIFRKVVLVSVLAIAIVVSLSLLVRNTPAGENVKQRLSSFYNFYSEKNIHTQSIHERLVLWLGTVQLIRDHPFLGVGAGNWKLAHAAYGMTKREQTGRIAFLQPHNDFLWVFSETGILGGAAFLLLFVFAISSLFKKDSFWKDSKSFVLHLALLTGLSMYMIHSFFDFPKERPLILFTFAAFLGMVSAVTLQSKARSFSRKVLSWVWVWMIVAGLSAIGFWMIRMHGERHLKKAVEARQTGNFSRMKSHLENINATLFEVDDNATPIAWYKSEAAYNLGDIASSKKSALSALSINPFQLYNLYSLGSIYYQDHKVDSTLYYWQKAVDIAPAFTDAAVNLSALYYNQGKIIKAAGLLSKTRDRLFQ